MPQQIISECFFDRADSTRSTGLYLMDSSLGWQAAVSHLETMRSARLQANRFHYTAALTRHEGFHVWQHAVGVSFRLLGLVDEVLAAVTVTGMAKGKVWRSAVSYVDAARNARHLRLKLNVVGYSASPDCSNHFSITIFHSLVSLCFTPQSCLTSLEIA